MFGLSEEEKMKKKIKEKAGTYEVNYESPLGDMTKKFKEIADEMNDYVGEKVIEIEDD